MNSPWRWWRSIGSPQFVAAPMVDASGLAFRLLCREFGIALAYTPMLNAKLMVSEPAYVKRHFDPHPSEGPLIAQLAGHDPKLMAEAARLCADQCSAIDINLGCPQDIASRGRYGAFLLEEEPETALQIVQALRAATPLPVTAKMRLQPQQSSAATSMVRVDLPATVDTALRLQDAGVSALCVHGRLRHQIRRQAGVGSASWEAVREVASALEIPVIANGGIARREDVDSCLGVTRAAAVMSAEALLENPALFVSNRRLPAREDLDVQQQTISSGGSIISSSSQEYLDQDILAHRYLELARLHPPPKGIQFVKDHLRRMLRAGWLQWPDLADELHVANDHASVGHVARRLKERGWVQPAFHTECERPELSWYARHREAGPARVGVSKSADDDDADWRRRYLGRRAAKRHSAARRRLQRL